MKWITLLLLGVLAEGSVVVAPNCYSSQRVDVTLVATQWRIGASAVPILNARNTLAAAKKFAEQYIKTHVEYAISLGIADYHQISGIGQDLIDTIQDRWAQLQHSLKETPLRNTQSDLINRDLRKLDDQLDIFLGLKPGNQYIESRLSAMPADLSDKSDNKNLTAEDAFLHFAEVTNDLIATVYAFDVMMYWNGWKNARKSLPLLQTQYRNQILNDQVMPEYRKVVDRVYSSGIQRCVDEETWARFVAARDSIVRLSDAYIKSLEAGENC